MWVAGAGKSGYVRPAIRGEALNMTSPAPSELSGLQNINDAEMHLFRAAQEQGATINAIGATRPVCPLCQERLPDEIPIVTDFGMLMGRPPEELLKQEVRELTDLLRHADSFADLRDALAARGSPASETILAGLIEGEDEGRYGVILTASQECVLFETAPDGSITRWEIIDKPDALTSDFQAVSVGISMMRSGEIS